MGADGSVAAAPAAPSAGLPQPACPGSRRDGRDLLRPAHRLPVGCAERHWDLLEVLGPPALTEWVEAGVFHEFWRQGLLSYDGLVGIDWEWLAADGAMTKAPLGGEKNRPQPDRPGQTGNQALGGDRRPRGSRRLRRRGRQRARLQAA